MSSAGVGRSGTYVTIDTLLSAIESNKSIDVNSTVRKLRMKRMQMVQSVVSLLANYKQIRVAMVTVRCYTHRCNTSLFMKLYWRPALLGKLKSQQLILRKNLLSCRISRKNLM